MSEGCIQLLSVLILNNYAVPVWDLHLTKDTNALEAVQRFACRVHIKRWDMSYSEQIAIMNAGQQKLLKHDSERKL